MPHLVVRVRKNHTAGVLVTPSERSQSKQTFLVARGSIKNPSKGKVFRLLQFRNLVYWHTRRLCGEHNPQMGPPAPENAPSHRCAERGTPPAPRLPRVASLPVRNGRICNKKELHYSKRLCQNRGDIPNPRREAPCHGSAPHTAAPTPSPSSIGQSQRFLGTWGDSPRPIQVLPCHRSSPREVLGSDEIPTTTTTMICAAHCRRPPCYCRAT